jgi:MOSC domain-containing protein YiiM
MSTVIAVCMSEKKGTTKKPIDKMRAKGFDLQPGDFAENITTRGVDLTSLPIGTRLRVGQEAVLEMTQIGKECHAACEIRRLVGDCIMPREGIFARVIHGGRVKADDAIKINKSKGKEAAIK